jgi:hypothetical protein
MLESQPGLGLAGGRSEMEKSALRIENQNVKSQLRSPGKLPYSAPKLVIRDIYGHPTLPIVREEHRTAPSVAVEEQKDANFAHEREGHVLYQEVFFFCTVPSVGDVPGPGCIYAETVVDGETGCAFAKVYPAKNPMDAVEILTSRVIPFFQHHGFTIRKINTPQTPEYFGLVPMHPFETFLETLHIEHSSSDQPGTLCNYLCLQFYRLLQKKFFQPALRKKFNFSLDELQKELDEFLDAYNAVQLKEWTARKSAARPDSKFPFDL